MAPSSKDGKCAVGRALGAFQGGGDAYRMQSAPWRPSTADPAQQRL